MNVSLKAMTIMKAITLSIFILFIISSSCKQVERVESITNEMNEEYLEVTGTHISLVPPTGFKEAENFNGIENDQKNCFIRVVEIGVTQKDSIIFSEKLKTEKQQEYRINGINARLFQEEDIYQNQPYYKYTLVLKTDTLSIFIYAMWPKGNDNLADTLRKSLLTVIYEPEREIIANDLLDFKVTIAQTKFRLANTVDKSAIYTVDGLLPTQSVDKTVLIISSYEVQEVIKDKKYYIIEQIRQTQPQIELAEEDVSDVLVDGIKGFEIVLRDEESLLFYTILYDTDTHYYVLMGIADDQFDENLNLFREVLNSFQRK